MARQQTEYTQHVPERLVTMKRRKKVYLAVRKGAAVHIYSTVVTYPPQST